MLARRRVYGGVGGHGVAIVCVVARRKRWDGWGVCDGGSLHYGIDRVGEFFVLLVVRRRCCWPAVLRVRCRRLGERFLRKRQGLNVSSVDARVLLS